VFVAIGDGFGDLTRFLFNACRFSNAQVSNHALGIKREASPPLTQCGLLKTEHPWIWTHNDVQGFIWTQLYVARMNRRILIEHTAPFHSLPFGLIWNPGNVWQAENHRLSLTGFQTTEFWRADVGILFLGWEPLPLYPMFQAVKGLNEPGGRWFAHWIQPASSHFDSLARSAHRHHLSMAAGSTRTWKDAQRVRGYNRVEGKRENKKTGRASEKIFRG